MVTIPHPPPLPDFESVRSQSPFWLIDYLGLSDSVCETKFPLFWVYAFVNSYFSKVEPDEYQIVRLNLDRLRSNPRVESVEYPFYRELLERMDVLSTDSMYAVIYHIYESYIACCQNRFPRYRTSVCKVGYSIFRREKFGNDEFQMVESAYLEAAQMFRNTTQ